jgi:hypothetical protein
MVTCGGVVVDDGGAPVTGRGMCWGPGQNPTIQGNHVASGLGTGSFTASLTGLLPSTVYHVRAYATNRFGTAYGRDVTSTTIPEATLCAVTTVEVEPVGNTSARCSGVIGTDGGSPITARGFCWGTRPNPTIDGSRTLEGSGTGAFTSTLSGLQPNTRYYVRAYAINRAGTAYGAETAFGCWQTSLMRVGPNPTGGAATIRYALSTQGPVQVLVYSAAGQRVRVVTSETRAVGVHSDTWDGLTESGGRAPNGIYYVRFAAPGFRATRSIAVLR